jgi:hypothetical protein
MSIIIYQSVMMQLSYYIHNNFWCGSLANQRDSCRFQGSSLIFSDITIPKAGRAAGC